MTYESATPASVATDTGARKSDRLAGQISSRHTQSDAANQDEFPIGRVYFAELPSQGLIKIGSTVNLGARLKNLASILPEVPVLLGTIEGGASEEMRWHARWAHVRRYRELFSATPELRAAIAAAVGEP